MADKKPDHWDAVERALHETFHLPKFRDGQEEIVRSVMLGHDTLAVMPTGSGKSLCYQLPAVAIPGLTLVISPLIALMKDQVDALVRIGIRAAALNSNLSLAAQNAIYDDIATGTLKILFVAPERMQNPHFQSVLGQTRIGLLAVDEAHCISQWGHDFRPDYRRLGALRKFLGYPVTIALTATASPEIQGEIIQQLDFHDPQVYILGFDRLNLRFEVRIFASQNEKFEYIRNFILSRIQRRLGFSRQYPGCGIIYAATIKQAEALGAYLSDFGIRAGIYHGQLSPAIREHIQEQFMNDEFHCLIATTAFGMGVDKPDIRYVLHLSMSSSIEAYTQESGRAGRDRLPAECTLLFTKSDIKIQEGLLNSGTPDLETYRTIYDAFARAAHAATPIPGTALCESEIIGGSDKKHDSRCFTAMRKLRADNIIQKNGERWIWHNDTPANFFKTIDRDTREQKRNNLRQLKKLTEYIYSDVCRTRFILSYFGSREARKITNCHHCDLCGALPLTPKQGTPGTFPPESMHFIPLKILSTFARCAILRLSITPRTAAAILTGSADAQYRGISTFRLLEYLDPAEILVITGLLRESGLLSAAPSPVLTHDGIAALAAKSLEQFPYTVYTYFKQRFPYAQPGITPWRPE